MMRAFILAFLLLINTLDHGLAENDGVHRLGAGRSSKNVLKKAHDLGSSNNKGGRRVKGIKGTQQQQQDVRGLNEQGLDIALAPDDAGIIGGMSATAGEFPFYVKFEGGTLCGGSLISPDTVLTAAHCVDSGRPSQVRIGSGQYNSGGIVAQTRCAVSHENFIENEKTLMNDVAIIKLKEPVNDPSVSTIAYNTNYAYPSSEGTELTVVGFGLTDNGGNVANVLQKLDTSFVSIADCMKTYSAQVVTPENHICADVKNAGDCNGDSGGPVMAGNLQVGIVSFGYGGCAADKYQDVYVNVAAYSDWIASYVAGTNCKPATVGGEDDSGTDEAPQDDTGGTEVETDPEAEEPSDFDELLSCFTTVIEVVQSLMGGEAAADENAKGNGGGGGGQQKGGNNNNNNKGGDKNNGGKRNGFLATLFGGPSEQLEEGDQAGGGGILNAIFNGAHALLSSEKADTAVGQYLGDADVTMEGDGGARR